MANNIQVNLPENCTFRADQWKTLSELWFPVARSEDVSDHQLQGAVLLDQKLVVYRSGDAVVVADNECPHLQASLSDGKIVEGGIQCPYHGLWFGAKGICTRVPQALNKKIPSGLKLKTYDVVEKYGLIWTRLARPAKSKIKPYHDLPHMPYWDDPDFVQTNCDPFPIAASAFRQVEGFIDVSHFPFVHQGTLADETTPLIVEPYQTLPRDVGFTSDYESDVSNYLPSTGMKAPEGFRWKRHFEVHPPFAATLTVHFPYGKLYTILNVGVPRSAFDTLNITVIRQNVFKQSSDQEVREFNREVFGQDARIVEAQPQRAELMPRPATNIEGDQNSIHYRKLLRDMGLGPVFPAEVENQPKDYDFAGLGHYGKMLIMNRYGRVAETLRKKITATFPKFNR